jgi:hypothetical protein
MNQPQGVFNLYIDGKLSLVSEDYFYIWNQCYKSRNNGRYAFVIRNELDGETEDSRI